MPHTNDGGLYQENLSEHSEFRLILYELWVSSSNSEACEQQCDSCNVLHT